MMSSIRVLVQSRNGHERFGIGPYAHRSADADFTACNSAISEETEVTSSSELERCPCRPALGSMASECRVPP